jgi:elongation factor Tu
LGVNALSDAELLALLLRHGRVGESALDLAGSLLAAHGGIYRMARARPEELACHPGVGVAKAAALVAAFSLAKRAAEPINDAAELRDASDVAAASHVMLADAQRERVVVLVCDARNRVKHRVEVAEGAIDRTPVPVREVLNAVLRHDGRAFAVAVTGVETFGKTMEHAEAGDNAALLLRGLRRQQARRGHVVAAPGSLAAHQRFAASIYLLPTAEGGRRTEIHTGYRPQFYVRTTDVVGVLDLGPAGAAMPGDRVDATIELGRPVALDTGLGFAIREGGRTVGAGTVTALLD